jgi:hypothetical protein
VSVEDLKLENKSLKLELEKIKTKKSNKTNTHCDVINDKSENKKMLYSNFFNDRIKYQHLGKPSFEKGTAYISDNKIRVEKFSNITVIKNKNKENLNKITAPTKIKEQITNEVKLIAAEIEFDKNYIEQMTLIQVCISKLGESVLDINKNINIFANTQRGCN